MNRWLIICMITSLVWGLSTLSALGQNTLSGTIVSKTDNTPVEMATVRLFVYHKSNSVHPATEKQTMDSTLVQGAQTTYDGLFVLNNIPAGTYRLIISSVGYADHAQEVKMPNHHLDLPHIRLTEQVHHLACGHDG